MGVDLIDNSPPNGDYVRYIEALMQTTAQGVGVAPTPQAGTAPRHSAPRLGRSSSKASVPDQEAGLPNTRGPAGPPDLGELMTELLEKLSGKPGSKGGQAIPAWWPWVAVAVVITGVLFPIAMAPLAIAAFVAWRFFNAPSGKTKGNQP